MPWTEVLREESSKLLWLAYALLLRSWDSLRDNKGLGLLALGLSGIIWLLISIEQNPLRTDILDANVKVEPVNVPGGLDVFGEIEPVRLRLSAPLDSWSRLDAKRFRASVDLSGAGAGIVEAPVKVEAADSRVRVVAIIPSRVEVRLEALKKESVPVKVNLTDSPPFGYTAGTPHLSTERVTVLGPESLVNQVEAAVAEVSLSGSKVNINHSFRLTARNERGYVMEGVSLDPASVMVEVPISQQIYYRTVGVSPVITGSVAPGYWIDSISVEPPSLMVVGTREAVESIVYLRTRSLDVNGASSVLVSYATLEVPRGLSVVGDARVLVRVSISPLLGTQILSLAPILTGLGEGRQASSEVSSIQVTLSGAAPLLKKLQPSEVALTLNLSGLSPGSYTLEPEIVVPQGIQVVGVSPERVKVQIR